MERRTKESDGTRRVVAALLTCAFVALLAPQGVAAPRDDAACSQRLDEARAYLSAHEMGVGEALAYVEDHAGAACAFDEAAPGAASAPTERVYTLADEGTTTETILRAPCSGADCLAGLDAAAHDVKRSIVACSLPGEGPGEITVTVLGLVSAVQPGEGTWHPTNDTKTNSGASGGVTGQATLTVEVDGNGAVSGGTQAAKLGVIRVAHAIPLAATDGSTVARCLKTVTTDADTYTVCAGWDWFVVFTVCKDYVTVTTNVTLEACSASATQIFGVLGQEIVRQQHDYEKDPNPCDVVNGASDGIVVGGP